MNLGRFTVKAERPQLANDAEMLTAERPRGVFSRQLIFGDSLDTEPITASYDSGVLTLQIAVAEQASPAGSPSPARARNAQSPLEPSAPPEPSARLSHRSRLSPDPPAGFCGDACAFSGWRSAEGVR